VSCPAHQRRYRSRGGVVRRQQCGNVYVEREQIADRVGILGAIETSQNRTTGRARARTIKLAFEPRDETVIRLLIGPTNPMRRHRTHAQLANDVLPRLGIGVYVGDVERVE
jgi:hypothetical protein